MITTRSGKTYTTQIKMATANNPTSKDHSLPPPLKDNTDKVLPDNIPDNISNKDLFISMQNITGLVQTLTTDVNKIRSEISDYNDVTNETNGIKEQLYTTQGKLACLTKKHEELEEKLTTYQMKDFEHDLVFYNMDESENENEHTLKTGLYKFLKESMKITDNLIFSRQNPAGEIRIDSAVRQGKYFKDKTRPVIVSFVTKSGRNIVYSKAYTKHLANPIKVRIAEHYPAIIKEKRQAQINNLIRLREQHKNSVISLRKDKLFIDGKETCSDNFKRNPISSMSPFSIRYDELDHSEPHTHKQSTFQAHALLIHSKDQAAAALNAIYQNPHLATATHHMYAYKIGVTGENVESGYSDDNEIKGGQTLMDLINEKKSSNILICVTRLKEGPNIGPKRFELIKKCANELLSSEDVYEDPVFNHVMFS